MQSTLEKLKAACPEVETSFLEDYLSRLDDRYFRTFEEKIQHTHIKKLVQLRPDNPVEILVDSKRDGSVACTVLAFDYPSAFSLITGVLAGCGFDIVSGDVFTYKHFGGKASRESLKRRSLGLTSKPDVKTKRRIIDYFYGTVQTSLPFASWVEEVKRRMTSVFSLLEKGGHGAVDKAKHTVNEMVVGQLAGLAKERQAFQSPVDIDVDNDKGAFTRLVVVSLDTPAFLYALTNALSLQGLNIEHVRIRTIGKRISDEIDIVDARGQKISNPDTLNRIKLSVLLTKEFTYFLDSAPSPFDALRRFESLVQDVLTLPEKGQWLELLSNPHALRDLAQLLGASDFLWEDFIRVQYEALLPSLQPVLEGRRFSETAERLPQRLEQALAGAEDKGEQKKRLNAFKDREIFLIDLDHILNPETDFRVLARRLVRLAETVLTQAVSLAYGHLTTRFGKPCTTAGLEARFAVLGLGKLGGADLGYASDIEFLFVYSDSGTTDGPEKISNAEFFEHLVKEITRFVVAKKEGIFDVDLRLRPYGNDGPLACSLDNFCRYYSKEGPSHSYERLALVRLRFVCGDETLGARIERIRDEMVYGSKSLKLVELRDLREKQFAEKTRGGKLNAKFSPGGAVDLEYAIQILQVMYGKENPDLRTPRTYDALIALSHAGVLSGEEALQLVHAYDFLRDLINAMRMLRGSAKDLFLPPFDSDEASHLARRMGYGRTDGGLHTSHRFRVDLETHMAAVRAFVDKHFGREALPGAVTGTVADLILSDNVSKELSEKILLEAGFQNPSRALVNLASLAGSGPRRHVFARLGLLACDILRQTPDADMALNNWERFVKIVPSIDFHYNLLLSQPMRLEILLTIFSGSQFLADTLVRYPGFLDWVTIPENLQHRNKEKDLAKEIGMALRSCGTDKEWQNKLRRFRRREILRIGTRDIYLGVSTETVMTELSMLADTMARGVVERVWWSLRDACESHDLGDIPEKHFCVMAMGKLGGRELNYSSDIDLLGVCDLAGALEKAPHADKFALRDIFTSAMERIRADLSTPTEEGSGYRVDLRLRPYGGAGDLVPSTSSLMEYYEKSASLWEVQAALKMRPIAGNLQVGMSFIKAMGRVFLQPREMDTIVFSVEKMRQAAIKACSPLGKSSSDIKCGIGGIRDIEFLVQGLQLFHALNHPELLGGNTLAVLAAMKQVDLLPAEVVDMLKQHYIYFRQVEHYLQLLEDRQIHAIPSDLKELTALAKRVHGTDGDPEKFSQDLDRRRKEVREAYVRYLLEAS